jgi:hypothetical protein
MWLNKALIATLTLMTAVSIVSCGGAVTQGSSGTNTSSSSNNSSSVALSIAAVTPTAALVSSAVALQVSGSGFNADSVILWNGTPTATTVVDNSTVATQLSASALAQPGDVDVLVQDAKSLQQSNHLKFHVFAPLSITTTSVPSASSGTVYSATLAATGGQSPYMWSLASGTLPTGVTLNSSGTFAGTPVQSGTFSFTVSAADSQAHASTASQSLALLVQAAVPPPLSITTSSLANATSGTAYSSTLAATGGQSPYKWGLVSGTFPTGMTLSTAGVLAGTPSQSGTFNFTVSATDSEAIPWVASLPLSLLVSAPLSITTTSLPSGNVNTAYSTTVSATGGVAPYSWSVSSGALPTGISLASTGVVSGTSSVSGTFNVTLGVRDSQGTSTTANFSITITAAPALQITTTTLPNGTEGSPYDATVSATGGTPPYTWSISSGSLPSAVALAATTGNISGTPSTSGTFTPTLRVTDSANNALTQSYSFTISGTADSVLLNWTASPSAGVTGYNVYRSMASGSVYAKITSSPVGGLTYTDTTVVDGQTYYYVVTSVDATGDESAYSEDVQMNIP